KPRPERPLCPRLHTHHHLLREWTLARTGRSRLRQYRQEAMAKKIDGYIKLQVKAGQANPAPPIGPALGARGVNIMEFCKQFNAATQERMGLILPVVITVYTDKSFS